MVGADLVYVDACHSFEREDAFDAGFDEPEDERVDFAVGVDEDSYVAAF